MRINFRSRKTKIFLILLILIAVVSLLWTCVPSRETRREAALCRVRAGACYALPAGGRDTLYLSLRDDSLQRAALSSDSVRQDTDHTAFFVSEAGHALTTDAMTAGHSDRLAPAKVAERLVRLDTLLTARLKEEKGKLNELDYYARTHSVIDDGYNEVMAYRERTTRSVRAQEQTLALITRLRKGKARAALLHLSITLSPNGTATCLPAHLVKRSGGLALLQLDCKTLPDGATRYSIQRYPTLTFGAELLGYNDFGGKTAAARSTLLSSRTPHLPATEGGPWVNRSGLVCAIARGKGRVPAIQAARLMRSVHAWPVWWFVEIEGKLRQWFSSKPDSLKPAPADIHTVCETFLLPDSSRYEGQVVYVNAQNKSTAEGGRKRQGYGRLTLPDGTRFDGRWDADTLAEGTRMKDGDRYVGTFNDDLRPDGFGREWTAEGDYYEGNWTDGHRSGHGFSCRTGRIVRCGEWRRDRFLGERMVYTSDRIYGIDISRYQHGKGRKYYPIDWGRLRITGLGGGRRVKGSVDYPVSYIYIKATEGRGMTNKYYAADLRAARRHGFAVGSYHFFTHTSSGAQQAAHFLRMAWVAPQDLPPVLDLEPTEEQIRKMGGRAALFRQVSAWLRIVEQRRGKRPVLYVSQTFVNRHLVHAPALLEKYDVWIARYGEYKPYVHLLHWQLTPHGRVRGITGTVDINVFNGTKAQFARYRRQH